MSFWERLRSVINKVGPLCAGIDPHPQILQEWDLPVTIAGLEKFVDICIEAYCSTVGTVGTVGIVKPQVAFFEAFGSAGYRILETAIAAFKAAGIIVIADAKRGDIGSTMDGYAHAWFNAENSALASDALTISAFMGLENLNGIINQAAQEDCGVFVLTKTSNPEARCIQQARVADNRTVSQFIVDGIAQINSTYPDPIAGLVIGATESLNVRLDDFYGPILVPGLGFQGGTIEHITRDFPYAPDQRIIIPTISRSLLANGPSVSQLSHAARRYNCDLHRLIKQ